MWKMLSGRVRYHVISADCALLLNALNSAKLILEDVAILNDLEFEISVYKKDIDNFLAICNKLEASVLMIRRTGLSWVFRAVLKRPVLVGLFCVLIGLFCYLPSRVLFVSVTGNSNITTKEILEAAENCGIAFGSNRREVRSEKMKNALLQNIPQLQWAGINTSGCTAIISVREKTTQQISPEENNRVSSIVASSDGVIQSCIVYQGNPLCSVGQAVKAGQTLVSGYTDCGIVTKTTQARAEINALTFREIEVYSPHTTQKRREKEKIKTSYSLRIGKKLIKFYKDSGNYSDKCAKIYEEKCVCLPGGFPLPIAVIKETVIWYDTVADESAVSDSVDWLADSAKSCLKDKMIAGEIVSDETKINTLDGAYYLYGRYACIEMIGQVKYEQTIIED